MSIPYVFCLLGILLIVPTWNYALFDKAFRLERSQIAADNVAIRWGKSDRATFKFIESSNRLLSGMELVHHVWHACALIPQTAEECIPKDLKIEEEMQALHDQAGAAAKALWRKGTLEGLSAAATLRVPITRLDRSEGPPLRASTCPLCWKKFQWHFDRSLPGWTSSVEVSSDRRIRAGTRIVESGASWDYLLHAGDT